VPVKALVIVIVCAAGVARADTKLVALAPIATLDAEDTSAPIKKLTAQLETSIAAIGGIKVIAAAQVGDAIKKAKKPQLRSCEGDAGCLTEVGKLVNAQIVVAGQLGGLGESRIVYLNATDVATGKELRFTTLTLGAKDDPAATTAAIVRLLAPDKHRGTLHFAIDVTGATVFVNGTRAKLTAQSELSLEVGTQAIRVTHPEYRDFVRFIDVGYGKTIEVAVGMTQYPIIRKDLAGKPINRDQPVAVDPPWYKRWYVVAGGAAVLMTISAIVVGTVVQDLPGTPCRIVGGRDC
jgi:hypothetical protein